jgi:alpha-L-arabinofuranosidase
VKDGLEAQIAVRGARVSSGEATVLTASDIHARNTFEQRQTVAPKTERLEIKGNSLTFRFPAASVTKLDLRLA